MNCKIDECNNKSRARNWCKKHYMRWLRHGDPSFVKMTMHGYSKHPLYDVWGMIKQRCCNKNCPNYKDYGSRGIRVCDEWKNSAKTFIEWCLENGWKKGFEIDRIDNDGDYYPENCRFVTPKKNNHNQRLLQKNNTSGYRGISYRSRNKKWVSQITINDKNIYLGLFNSPRLAALRYDAEAYLIDDRPRNFL